MFVYNELDLSRLLGTMKMKKKAVNFQVLKDIFLPKHY